MALRMNSDAGIQVRSVHSRSGLRRFVRFPYHFYHDDPNWVAPLRSDEWKFHLASSNPFLKENPVTFFMAYRNGYPVGRIAGIINLAHNRHHNEKTAFFGRFECEDRLETARALVDRVERWALARDAVRLRGPTDFSINNVSGLLEEGFTLPPAILMPYNPPWYQSLLKRCGFQRVMTFFAYHVDSKTIRFPGILDRLETRLKEQGFTFRYPDYGDLERESQLVVDLFNRAWADNWGFVPLRARDMLDDFHRVKGFALRNLILIAERFGKPVGFSLSLPDVNQALLGLQGRLFPLNWLRLMKRVRRIDRIRVLLMGVVPEYRNRGIDLIFYRKTMINAIAHGIHKAELSWILKSNGPMNQVLKHINAYCYKTYCMVEKSLKLP